MYKRQEIYGKLKADIGQILRKLCEEKKVEILEAQACSDHIHMGNRMIGFIFQSFNLISFKDAVEAIGAEAGWKWAAAAVAYNTVLAWVVAWAVYRLFMWL